MKESEFREILRKCDIALNHLKSIMLESIEDAHGLERGSKKASRMYEMLFPMKPTGIHSVSRKLTKKKILKPIDVANFFAILELNDVDRIVSEILWNEDFPAYDPSMASQEFDPEDKNDEELP
jgi:hypothetical protein